MSIPKAIFDRPIAYHRAFAEIGGGVTAAVLLSQAYYWSFRTKDPDGWFYKSFEDWTKETGLTRSELETAREKLVKRGILEYKLKGIPAVGHYKVNHEKIIELISVCDNPADQFAENLQTSLQDSYKLDAGKPANINKESETTPETTTDITHSASEEKSRIVAALQRSSPPLDHSGLNVLDVSKYPEDIKPVIIKVCQLWNLRPPNGKDKAYWIEAGRELLDACGEFGPGLLDKVRADFVSYMEAHQGIPQFTVAGPKSLVNSARAAAGLKRGGQSILPGADYIDPDEQYSREPSRGRR